MQTDMRRLPAAVSRPGYRHDARVNRQAASEAVVEIAAGRVTFKGACRQSLCPRAALTIATMPARAGVLLLAGRPYKCDDLGLRCGGQTGENVGECAGFCAARPIRGLFFGSFRRMFMLCYDQAPPARARSWRNLLCIAGSLPPSGGSKTFRVLRLSATSCLAPSLNLQ